MAYRWKYVSECLTYKFNTGVIDFPAVGNVVPPDTVDGVTGTYSAGSTPTPPVIAVAWLSSTSVRFTFSNSQATVTNNAWYALSSDGGDTWLDGGNRSGDGTLDVTGLTEGGTYDFVGQSTLGGYYSKPSNIVDDFVVYGDPSSNPTITPVVKRELVQREVLRNGRDEQITESHYALGVGATLATASLEPGDALPDNASSEILSSSLQKFPGTAKELGIVIAREPKEWADDTGGSDTAVELFHSRVEESGSFRHHFVRIFEVAADSLAQSAEYWGASGLPVFGATYPHGNWAGLVTPTAGQIEADPRSQTKRARITVHYFAPRTK